MLQNGFAQFDASKKRQNYILQDLQHSVGSYLDEMELPR